MSDKWYRGEMEGGKRSSVGGAIHDFGDGLYFTNDFEVAQMYADLRSTGNKNKARVYEVSIKRQELGIVLDLTQDSRWIKFMQTELTKGITAEKLIKMANENYGRFFEIFLKQNKINLNQYDAVIGKEYVRGGLQLCILYKNGMGTKFQERLRRKFNLAQKGDRLVGGSMVQHPNISRIRRLAKNQSLADAIGRSMSRFALWLGEREIRNKVASELENRKAEIKDAIKRGNGVLIIISLEEWENADFQGNRVARFKGLGIKEGKGDVIESAMPKEPQSYNNPHPNTTYKELKPPNGWRNVWEFGWISPFEELPFD